MYKYLCKLFEFFVFYCTYVSPDLTHDLKDYVGSDGKIQWV